MSLTACNRTVENDLQQELLDLKAGLQALEQNETDEQDQLKQVEEEVPFQHQSPISVTYYYLVPCCCPRSNCIL